jgi:hypothetical protein
MEELTDKDANDTSGETTNKLEGSLKDISELFLSERTIGTPLTQQQNQELLDFVTQIFKLDSKTWGGEKVESVRREQT